MDSIAGQWRFVDRTLSLAADYAGYHAAQNTDAAVGFAVETAIETAGLISVSGLARRVNLSSRQLERRFLDSVGMTPKRFCRIRRFQRVLQAMEEPGANWADAAVQCGYYDQAHLIRDFRRFSGLTPACLLGADTDLAAHFVQNYAPSHFSNTARRLSVRSRYDLFDSASGGGDGSSDAAGAIGRKSASDFEPEGRGMDS